MQIIELFCICDHRSSFWLCTNTESTAADPLRNVWRSMQDLLENACNDSVAARSEELESHISVCTDERIKLALEKRTSAMEAGLHIFFTELKALRGFSRAQSLDFPKHEHRPVIVGKGVKGLFEQRLQLSVIDLLFGIASVRFHIHTHTFQHRNAIDLLMIDTSRSCISFINSDFR